MAALTSELTILASEIPSIVRRMISNISECLYEEFPNLEIIEQIFSDAVGVFSTNASIPLDVYDGHTLIFHTSGDGDKTVIQLIKALIIAGHGANTSHVEYKISPINSVDDYNKLKLAMTALVLGVELLVGSTRLFHTAADALAGNPAAYQYFAQRALVYPNRKIKPDRAALDFIDLMSSVKFARKGTTLEKGDVLMAATKFSLLRGVLVRLDDPQGTWLEPNSNIRSYSAEGCRDLKMDPGLYTRSGNPSFIANPVYAVAGSANGLNYANNVRK